MVYDDAQVVSVALQWLFYGCVVFRIQSSRWLPYFEAATTELQMSEDPFHDAKEHGQTASKTT